MDSIPINRILTHINPDLDGMLSILLLRKFGDFFFPGVSTAKVNFSSASELPDDMSPAQLEKKGILAVDIGGGRFDSHPTKSGSVGKIDRAAADLVAEKLGLLKDEIWQPLIEYTRMHDTTGHGLYSKEILHHVFSLNSILEGLTLLYENDSTTLLEMGIQIISVIPSYTANKNTEINSGVVIEIINKYFALKGIDQDETIEDFNHFREWYNKVKTNFELTSGKHPLDQLVSLSGMMHGAFYYFEKDENKLQEYTFQALDAILVREQHWYSALKQYKEESKVKKIGGLIIASISSGNGMVIKAARMIDNPDILVYHSPLNGAVTIFIQRRGKLHNFPFENIVARIRLAEAIEKNEKFEFNNLSTVGTYYGWFLHQSRNIIIRGSRKQNDFIPTCIPLSRLNDIIYAEFDHENVYEMNPKFMSAWLKFRNPIFRK